MKRGIPMSGTTSTVWGHYAPNSHVELFKEIFGLDAGATGEDVLQYMLDAPVEELLVNSPAISVSPLSLVVMPFSTVIEDVNLADEPFLTRRPQEIYETTNVNVPAMFGMTSAETIILLNPADPYSFLEPLRNYSNIGLPFNGLTLSPDSPVYRNAQEKIYKFYFGDRELEPTVEILEIYLQMTTDMNFAYPVYEALELHSAEVKTFCYEDDLDLNLNAIKITRGITYLKGMSHMEDLLYIFYAKMFADQFASVYGNPNDPTNQKTIAAHNFSTKMFTDYAKTGRPTYYGQFNGSCSTCVAITNAGLQPVCGFRNDVVKFWASIHDSVKRWIVKPF